MTKRIPLTQGQFALVDDEDYERLSRFKWQAMETRGVYYAIGSDGTLMHRLIMGTSKNKVCDHINHNTLDNRKTNLRNCSHSQNQMNRNVSSTNKLGIKCVDFHKPNRKYRAQIKFSGKKIHIGYYKTKEEAANAYNKKASELFGEFAIKNNIVK